MSVCCKCCVLSGRDLCVGADHPPRGVPLSVVCPTSVIANPLKERHETEAGRSATEKERKSAPKNKVYSNTINMM